KAVGHGEIGMARGSAWHRRLHRRRSRRTLFPKGSAAGIQFVVTAARRVVKRRTGGIWRCVVRSADAFFPKKTLANRQGLLDNLNRGVVSIVSEPQAPWWHDGTGNR